MESLNGLDTGLLMGRQEEEFITDIEAPCLDGSGDDAPVVVFFRELVDILNRKAQGEALLAFPRGKGIQLFKNRRSLIPGR